MSGPAGREGPSGRQGSMGPPGTPGPKGETGPNGWRVVCGGGGRETGGVTWVALVGTKVHAQCLEKPGSSEPGRPCLGLTLNFPTLTEFPNTVPGRDQVVRSSLPGHSYLELCVTSFTAEVMVPAEHTLSHASPMCSFLRRSGCPRHAGLPRPRRSQRRERCPW